MDLIFLDMDGVLNATKEVTVCYNNKYTISPVCVERFNQIMDTINIPIIWSSSWRYGESLQSANNIFKICNIKGNIIGKTPLLHKFYSMSETPYVPRKREIREFLRHFKQPVEKIVIIDDDPDADLSPFHNNAKFFNTNLEFGLTEQIKEDVISFLN